MDEKQIFNILTDYGNDQVAVEYYRWMKLVIKFREQFPKEFTEDAEEHF